MEYYKHYKGNYYRKIGEARHSETLEEMVVYQALYGEQKMWVRPKSMFYESVTLPDGQTVPRFTPCSEEEAIASQQQAAADGILAQLLDSLFADFKAKGYTAEDFYGGCALCGDANEFALDQIEAKIKMAMPSLSKIDCDQMTLRLYNELHRKFEDEEH